MSQYKSYPAYKDSGVEWLGQVPEHWESARFDAKTTTHRDSIEAGRLNGMRVLHYSIPAVQEFGCAQEEDGSEIDSNKLVVGQRQLLVSKLNPHKQTLVVADRSDSFLAVASTEFVPLIPVSAELDYITYVWSSAYCQHYLLARCESSTRSHQRVAPSDITRMQWAWPDFEEQAAIVSALNHETARIDALVAKKTRFIELLREKRQALITHAVTKGLDPNVKMKDSGVEWLGEVPEHWNVKAIRWLSPVQRGASPRPIDNPVYFDDDGDYGWVRIEDVTASDGFLEETKQRLSDLGSSLSVKLSPGALFLSIAGSVGKPCITRIKACIHDGFVYFPLLKIDPMWLVRIFESRSPFVGLGKLGTQLNLNTETVGSIKVAFPPAGEIGEILSELDRRLAHLGQLISRTEHSITLLKERRSALITAAVTGQIDLREAV